MENGAGRPSKLSFPNYFGLTSNKEARVVDDSVWKEMDGYCEVQDSEGIPRLEGRRGDILLPSFIKLS